MGALAGYVGAALVAVLGIVVWWLNNRAKTRQEIDRAEVAAKFKEAQDALRDGDTRALALVLEWLRQRERR